MKDGRFEEDEILVVKNDILIPEDKHYKYQSKFRCISYNSYGCIVYCENINSGEYEDILEDWLESAYKKEVPFKRNFDL